VNKVFEITVRHKVEIQGVEDIDPGDLTAVAMSAAIASWGGNHRGEGLDDEFVLGDAVRIAVDNLGAESPYFMVEDVTDLSGVVNNDIAVSEGGIAPEPDGPFPQVDNRDQGETWIWVGPTTHVEVGRGMARQILESYVQD